MSAVVHFVCFLRKGRDKGNSGHSGDGFCQVIDAISVREPVGRRWGRGYQVIMVSDDLSAGSLEEREKVPGHLSRLSGVSGLSGGSGHAKLLIIQHVYPKNTCFQGLFGPFPP